VSDPGVKLGDRRAIVAWRSASGPPARHHGRTVERWGPVLAHGADCYTCRSRPTTAGDGGLELGGMLATSIVGGQGGQGGQVGHLAHLIRNNMSMLSTSSNKSK
jgi:hypothetical protein